MSDKSSMVRSLLAERGIPTAGSVIKDAQEGNHYFAVVSISRDDSGRQSPTTRKLQDVASELAASGINIKFIESEPQTADVEGGLRAALVSAFNSLSFSLAVAIDGKRATVWMEVDDAPQNPEFAAEIRSKINDYLDAFEIADRAIQIYGPENFPSITACLRVIRKMAPVQSDVLSNELRSAGFTVSAEWLARRLDALRRSGRVVRLRTGAYVLTADSLQRLGTIKGRSSPDIVRMLALARRTR